jgi:glycine/D-amino acid oxidase-like deaminating enzyme
VFLYYESETGDRSEPEIYPRPDGTVYLCGIGDNEPLPPKADQIVPKDSSCAQLHTIAGTVSSKLLNAPVLAKQVCYVPYSRDSFPLIGK